MKITKYYCDACKKEVESEKDFIKVPCISKSWSYYDDGDEEIIEKEICMDCLESLSNHLDKISKNNKDS